MMRVPGGGRLSLVAVLVLWGLIALTLTMAACGGSGDSGSSGQGGATGGGGADGAGKKLSVWIMEGTNPDSTAYFEKV